MVKDGNNVDHPNHYNRGGIETIDFIEDQNMGFLIGNIVKYISRYRHKNGFEDLKKALWYFNRLIKETIRRYENNTIDSYIPVAAYEKISLDSYAEEQGLTYDETEFIRELLNYQFNMEDKFLDSLKIAQIHLHKLFDDYMDSHEDLTFKKLIYEANDLRKKLHKLSDTKENLSITHS